MKNFPRMVSENGHVFTRDQADGAIPNGSRIVKTNSEAGDGHRDGTLGTVIGSIAVTEDMRAKLPPALRAVAGTHVYVIGWDSAPQLPVFVSGGKVARTS